MDEALAIVRRSEDAGLVHNISNAEGEVTFMCNCCSCCCPILGAMKKGLKNVSQPSRFHAVIDSETCTNCMVCVDYCYVHALTDVNNELAYDIDLCIGCGLCASHCPESAIQMVLREKPRKIYESAKQLDGQIQREAIVGKIKTLISG